MADSNKLSNVIGAPFDPFVRDQLNLRAKDNTSTSRTPEQVLFLANKTAWVRLISSVNLVEADAQKVYGKLPIVTSDDKNGLDGLAKNWTLEAGTSAVTVADKQVQTRIRSGLGVDGAYGFRSSLDKYGYRPMPGLTDVAIESQGTLGSLRGATISFKIWTMDQLDVMELLYFRLGYSMFIEWGHVQYHDNTGKFQTNQYGIDVFSSGLNSKELIQQAVYRNTKNTSGNYDGMLGMVVNYDYAMNQEGGFDCTLKLAGLGSVIDTIKINSSYQMPNALYEAYKNTIKQIQTQQQTNTAGDINNYPPCVRQFSIVTGTDGSKYANGTGQYSSFAFYYNNAYYDTKLQKVLKYDCGGTDGKAIILDPSSSVAPTAGAGGEVLDRVARNPQELYQQYVGDVKTPTTYQQWLTGWVPDYGYTATGMVYQADLSATNPLYSYYFVPKYGPRQKYGGLFIPEITNKASDRQRAGWKQVTNGSSVTLSGTEINYELSNFAKVPGSAGAGMSSTVGQWMRYASGAPGDADYNYGTRSYDAPSFTGKIFQIGDLENFNFTINYHIESSPDDYASLTWQQVWNWLDSIFKQSVLRGSVRKVEKGSGFLATIEVGLQDLPTIPLKYTGKATNPAAKVATGTVTLEFNNPYLILTSNGVGGALSIPSAAAKPASAAGAASGSADSTTNNADTTQTDDPNKFQSALHAMLVSIQSSGILALVTNQQTPVIPVSTKENTTTIFSAGVLNGVIGYTGAVDANNFDLKAYANRGFNSSLMLDPDTYKTTTPTVDWDSLCTAYAVRYELNQSNSNGIPEYPVYIKLGYLLAFLNSMCLIYDSQSDPTATKTAAKTVSAAPKPFVYIDFNPETNFCLSTPQHLSIDPTTCLIPFQGTKGDYDSIFPANLVPSGEFDPATQNYISNVLTNGTGKGIGSVKFRSKKYQGKTMEILVNVSYLIKLLDSLSGSDARHSVNLKPFLERVMDDINKSTGCFNMFSVSYNDESNTVFIKDNQTTPGYEAEDSGIIVPDGVNPGQYTTIPIFGQDSLVRAMQFKTEMSTRLASMLAISAQSTGDRSAAVNSLDGSSFSWQNEYTRDRYIPFRTEAASTSPGTNPNLKAISDKDLATQFDAHVKSIYYGTPALDLSRVDTAKNYYIERLSKLKGQRDPKAVDKDTATNAAPFIPMNLDITIDGIAGIHIGNSFTIPDDRLPASLRGDGTFTKVGFIISGLRHTIVANEWLTSIKGQMIKIKTKSLLSAEATAVGAATSGFTPPAPAGSPATGNASAVIKGKALYNDQAFRTKLKAICAKYNISDENVLKVMNAESGLNPADSLYYDANKKAYSNPGPGRTLFATGLIQWTSDNVAPGGTPGPSYTLEQIRTMPGIQQLDLVDMYFDYWKHHKRDISGQGMLSIYGLVFFPALVPVFNSQDTTTIVQAKGLSAASVSKQNPVIARAAGKLPGTPLTVADFRAYVNSIS